MIHKILTGDKLAAARWLPLGVSLVRRLAGLFDFSSQTFNPAQGITIRVRVADEHRFVYVDAVNVGKYSLIILPHSDSASSGWGFPIKDGNGDWINKPLGTVGGTTPTAVIRRGGTKWDILRRTEVETANIDWKSSDANIPVVTWWGPINRYIPSRTYGTGSMVYINGEEITAPGVVLGACIQRKNEKYRLIVITTDYHGYYAESSDLNFKSKPWVSMGTAAPPTAVGIYGGVICFNGSGTKGVQTRHYTSQYVPNFTPMNKFDLFEFDVSTDTLSVSEIQQPEIEITPAPNQDIYDCQEYTEDTVTVFSKSLQQSGSDWWVYFDYIHTQKKYNYSNGFSLDDNCTTYRQEYYIGADYQGDTLKKETVDLYYKVGNLYYRHYYPFRYHKYYGKNYGANYASALALYNLVSEDNVLDIVVGPYYWDYINTVTLDKDDALIVSGTNNEKWFKDTQNDITLYEFVRNNLYTYTHPSGQLTNGLQGCWNDEIPDSSEWDRTGSSEDSYIIGNIPYMDIRHDVFVSAEQEFITPDEPASSMTNKTVRVIRNGTTLNSETLNSVASSVTSFTVRNISDLFYTYDLGAAVDKYGNLCLSLAPQNFSAGFTNFNYLTGGNLDSLTEIYGTNKKYMPIYTY